MFVVTSVKDIRSIVVSNNGFFSLLAWLAIYVAVSGRPISLRLSRDLWAFLFGLAGQRYLGRGIVWFEMLFLVAF